MSGQVYAWQEAPEADFAVIGDPVAHSLSPKMHSAAYQAAGLSYRYVAVRVIPGEVGAALERLSSRGYQGVNVTVPHKEEVLEWCDSVEPFAAKVRAANTIRLSDRTAINTDGPGFLETLYGVSKRSDQHVLMLGAGGSARAIGQALVDAGFPVAIYNRTASKAAELAESLGPLARLVDRIDLKSVFLLLNSTSASISGERLPIEWSEAHPDMLAYDLMYKVGLTPFLQEAADHGLATQDGRELLVAQGALAYQFWLCQPASKAAMREAIQ